MSDPHVFRVTRPYRTVDEFVEAEAAWLQRKTILVVDAEELPPDTVVRFGIDLEAGEAVIALTPGTISTSRVNDRSAERSLAATRARDEPKRTSGASVATRWLPPVAR